MSLEISQNELFNDLQTILLIVKNKFNKYVYQHIQYDHLLEKQKQIDKQLMIIIHKYSSQHLKQHHKNTLQRFICRVKEIMQKAIVFISKKSNEIIKNIQSFIAFTAKSINPGEIHKTFMTLLELIPQIGQKAMLKQSNSLLLKPQQASYISNYQSESLSPKKSVNEAELLSKHSEKYQIINIDNEYLRGQYFDLKEDRDNSVYNAILARNRYIKQIMNNYEKRYSVFKTNEHNHIVTHEDKAVLRRTLPLKREEKTIQYPARTKNRFYTSRSVKKHQQKELNIGNRQDFNFNQFLDHQNMENNLHNYRTIHEEKLKQKKILLKVHNFTILNEYIQDNVPVDTNYNSKVSKRSEFFKKSQQQIRLRYKYYNYNDVGFDKKIVKKSKNNSIKIFGLSPQKQK